MSFDPKAHLIDLNKNPKNPRWYLETKWRICWFRDVHPQGKVNTEVLCQAPPLVKASVLDGDGVVIATGHGTATPNGKAVWTGREIEKAETAAIGRALGHAGFGTQFSDEDETDHLADSPMATQNARPTPPSNGSTAPTKSGGSPDAAPILYADVFGISWHDKLDGTGTYYRLHAKGVFGADFRIVAFDKTALDLLGFDLKALTEKDKVDNGYDVRVPYFQDTKDGKTYLSLDAEQVLLSTQYTDVPT